jgi:hypothetical protein
MRSRIISSTELTKTGALSLCCAPFFHPWENTQHCLRDAEGTCVNDHTGCLWNDGHNGCGHPAAKRQPFDSPLRRKDSGEGQKYEPLPDE